MLEKANKLRSNDPTLQLLGWALFKLERYKGQKLSSISRQTYAR